MIEFLKHIFGVCGEGHINIWLFITPIITFFYLVKHQISWCFKYGCDFCKSKAKSYRNL